MDGWMVVVAIISNPITQESFLAVRALKSMPHTHTHTHTHVYINILSFPHFDSRKNLLATDAVAQIFQTQPIPIPYFFIIPKPPLGVYFLPALSQSPTREKNKK
jgi:hypothetical protein